MKTFIISISLIFILLFNVRADSNPGEKIVSERGSKYSQNLQNWVINKYHLTRIKNYEQMESFILKGLLVPIDRLENVNIDYRLRKDFSFAKPFVADFLLDFGAYHFKGFGLWIMVNSTIRPIDSQKELYKTNPNAAPWWQSAHTTGAAVDISYRDMSDAEIFSCLKYLKKLEKAGVIEMTMEINQPVFHIMVFPWYSKYRQNKK